MMTDIEEFEQEFADLLAQQPDDILEMIYTDSLRQRGGTAKANLTEIGK